MGEVERSKTPDIDREVAEHPERYSMPEPGIVLSGTKAEPPQWVIMGIELPDGRVGVMASSTLTRAEMRRRWENYTAKSTLSRRPLHLQREITAVGLVCEGFTFIPGDTYAECMSSLATVWQPPELGS
jgi:hypothetical protein